MCLLCSLFYPHIYYGLKALPPHISYISRPSYHPPLCLPYSTLSLSLSLRRSGSVHCTGRAHAMVGSCKADHVIVTSSEVLERCSCEVTMATDGDFLLRYRAVSNKLKKRFLRKPNVSEASEQFGQLAKELKQQDCLQYAGFCNLAMARCEQTLFNAPGEAMALTEAARLFLHEEKETQRLRCPGFEEHLQAAINCYSFAIKVYIELNQPVMAASLCLELGNALKDMNKLGEALVYFQRAAELQTQVPIECLLSLGYVASCKILTRDYDGALAVFTEMQLLAQEKGLPAPGSSLPVGAFLDIIAKCEVSRVLLLMLLQPPPQKLLPEHAQTLEKYDWEAFDSHNHVNYLTEEVFLLLQSVVMACQENDIESLKVLQVELWPLLTAEQNHLLHLVLQETISPSGQGI